MKKRLKSKILLTIASISTAMMISGCKKNSSVDQANKVYVETVNAYGDKAYETIAYAGTVTASCVSNVHCEIKGIVTDIYFKQGQKISKGDLLYNVKSEEVDGNLTKAKAVYQEQKALYEKYEKIYKNGGCTEMEYQQVYSKYKQAEGDYTSAKGQHEKRVITAPISGMAGVSYVNVGGQVGYNGSTKMVTIVDNSGDYYVDFYVDQSIARKVLNIQADKTKVKVFVLLGDDSLPVEAEFVSMDTEPDPQTKMILCRSVVKDNSSFIHGDSVKVFLQIDHGNGVFVPSTSVVTEESGRNYVFVVSGEKAEAVGVVVRRECEKQNGDNCVEGIPSGAQIVLSGQYKLSSSHPNSVVVVKG